jgi:hypothetical protein
MLNECTHDIVLYRQARVVHGWWFGLWPNRMAQLLIDQGGDSSLGEASWIHTGED